jgi:hypothetical protein
MPPLFVYAVVFLSLLVAVGFMVCLREGREPQARKAGPGPVAPRAPLRRMPAEPHAAQPALASTRPFPHAASVAAAGPAHAEPPLRRALLSGGRASRSPPPRRFPPGGGRLRADPAPAAWAPGPRTLPDPAAAPLTLQPAARTPGRSPQDTVADPLALQVAELTRQVGELKAERQSFEDEIRRLHRVVQEATAVVGRVQRARPARPRPQRIPGARHINIQDLRLRRLG